MLLEYLIQLYDEYNSRKYFGARDLSDKLTDFMMVFLLIASVATSYKLYVNSPFACFTPINPTGENFLDYSTNYIWTHGSIPKTLFNESSIKNLEEWNILLNANGIHYYQWVPFILLFHCCLLFMCRYLWVSACSTKVSQNLNTLLLECQNISSACNNDDIKQLAQKFLLVINKKEGKNNFTSE